MAHRFSRPTRCKRPVRSIRMIGGSVTSRCSGAPTAACGPRPIMEPEPTWTERSLGLTRFKLRETTLDRLRVTRPDRSLVPGDVLPSVSRRDPRRKDATVWTSGNRIFGCDGTATLTAIIDGINAGEAPEITVGMQDGRAPDEQRNEFSSRPQSNK